MSDYHELGNLWPRSASRVGTRTHQSTVSILLSETARSYCSTSEP